MEASRSLEGASGSFWRLLAALEGFGELWKASELLESFWKLLEGFWGLLEGFRELLEGLWKRLEASGGFWKLWKLLEASGSARRLLEASGMLSGMLQGCSPGLLAWMALQGCSSGRVWWNALLDCSVGLLSWVALALLLLPVWGLALGSFHLKNVLGKRY